MSAEKVSEEDDMTLLCQGEAERQGPFYILRKGGGHGILSPPKSRRSTDPISRVHLISLMAK